MLTPSFLSALDTVYAQAQAKLDPSYAEALEKAYKLVYTEQVRPAPTGKAWLAQGARDTPYRITHPDQWACECADHIYRGHVCKHILATQLFIRATRQAQAITDAIPASEPAANDTEAPEEENVIPDMAPHPDATLHVPHTQNGASTPTVPPQYIVMIQGKPFIRFCGLLQMAHEQHLVELSEAWTYNDAELSLAHAVCIFEDGRRFEGSGDSAPANVGKKVALHWRRVSLTRAKSRALRDALNIDMVAVEELGELD